MVKPFLPRQIQIWLRSLRVRGQRARNRGRWPIWEEAASAPPSWPGWPGGKKFAFVLAHDVESAFGVSHCERLAKVDLDHGCRSMFGFVPLRYETPEELRRNLVGLGFDVTVQGLYHDGKDFSNRRAFDERRERMEEFLHAWGARGFSAPASLHHLSWFSELDIDFDVSVFDVDPFEPQPCHHGRIFPFWVRGRENSGFVELPNTLVQDFTLFVLMRERTSDIWRNKVEWIAEHGGLALVKTHPDYMAFAESERRMDRYPVRLYTEFLESVQKRYGNVAWFAKPSEVAQYWRTLNVSADPNDLAFRSSYCNRCRETQLEGRFSHYPVGAKFVEADKLLHAHSVRAQPAAPVEAADPARR
jgi:hypothetical protein